MNSMLHHQFPFACITVLVLTAVMGEPLRVRRQVTPSKVVVDLLVVVDVEMYARFQEWTQFTNTRGSLDSQMKTYVSILINEVNARYANLRSSAFNVSTQLVDIKLNMSIPGMPSSGSLDPLSALDYFKSWLNSSFNSSSYDHALLLTGRNLGQLTTGADTRGRAYLSEICGPAGVSSSVVQGLNGLQSALFIAHELGHNLGSSHDGDPNSPTCSSSDRYIMATQHDPSGNDANKLNPWYFSTCSKMAITTKIDSVISSSSSDCFSRQLPPLTEFTSSQNLVTGQVYPKDVQCKMLNGNSSVNCLGGDYGQLKDICTSMYCLNSIQSGVISCSLFAAAEGTSCGDKQWCRSGQCVSSDAAPSVDQTCPNGEVLSVSGSTCPDFVRSQPHKCYEQTFRTQYCCVTCASRRTSSPDCTYGDKRPDCDSRNCMAVFEDGTKYSEACCATCSKEAVTSQTQVTTRRSATCVDVTSIDGQSCSQRATYSNMQNCYNQTVEKSCCFTCASYYKNIQGCQYGDRLLGGRCDVTSQKANICRTNKSQCCASCNSGMTANSAMTATQASKSLMAASMLVTGVMFCKMR